MEDSELINTQKVRSFIFFAFFVVLILIFLSKLTYEAFGNRTLPSQTITQSDRSIRGKIITADGFSVAQSSKKYKAQIYGPGIDPQKRELFINLFSIYSGIEKDTVKKRMGSFNKNVILSYKIDASRAKYLKELSRKLYQLGAYRRIQTQNGGSLEYKLEILESGESRDFIYLDTLTPLLGHMTKVNDKGYTKSVGLKGIEKQYERELSNGKDGYLRGKRDVRSNLIFDSNSIVQFKQDGFDIHLNINLQLQKQIEQMLDEKQKAYEASEVLAVVMHSDTGKVISLASSNRYNPSNILQSQISYLNPTATEYLYEPGSVIKPITFALLLEHNRVNPLELINTEGGRWRLNGYMITDEHKHDWMSAENTVVYSSNIGIAKLAQRLEGFELYEGFEKYGLTSPSNLDIPYERAGKIQNISNLNRDIYKASSAYGYGLVTNLMQQTRALNVFNNGGYLVNPQVVDKMVSTKQEHMQKPVKQQIISSTIAAQMNKIMQKVVKDGSAQRALTPGLQIGGKTGTAHISVKGQYENLYNSTFIGFANDTNNRYTIAVLTKEPKVRYRHFASLTSVPVFKEIVDTMIDLKFLTPSHRE
ncbi:MAG: peptidoglycan D,D-transpeptidase FtsI family protein [Campylobacterota bacterium]